MTADDQPFWTDATLRLTLAIDGRVQFAYLQVSVQTSIIEDVKSGLMRVSAVELIA